MDRNNIRQIYQQRRQARQDALEAFEKKSSRIANLRLLVFVAGIATLLAAILNEAVSYLWLLLPAVGFLVLVFMHDRVERETEKRRAAMTYYTRGLHRLNHTWIDQGNQQTHYTASDHPYAADLDLFGAGSLFELLCTCKTLAGEQQLANWLTQPTDFDEVRQRQEAIDELRERIDLREDLWIIGGDVRATLHPKILQSWGDLEPAFPKGRVRLLKAIAAFSAISITGCIAGIAIGAVPIYPLIALILVELALYRFVNRRLRKTMAGLAVSQKELNVLAGLLKRIENEPADGALLTNLQNSITEQGTSASHIIERLDRLVARLDTTRNQLFAPLAYMWMIPLFTRLSIETWRQQFGIKVGGWMDTTGKVEAISAMSGYAYEHPGAPFPKLAETGPRLVGKQLCHPLLPDPLAVPNSIELGETRLMIVSGSNMSGKSTFLRVIGINVVLANAGLPICGESLTLSPLIPGATIRIQDSLMEGSSRFYSEINRLRQLVEMAEGDRTLIFLIDEVLHGTNSHDRRIGGQAVLRGLVQRGAIGLVTTHDLALSEMVDSFGGKARNVHFEDHIEDGRVLFDYKLRDGIVRKSNALELMRSVGLDV